jgi:hypothetical protein
MMFFNWIRNLAKQAVLAGVEDAAAELEGPTTGETSTAITSLRNRVLALPAGEPANDAETPKKKSKVA